MRIGINATHESGSLAGIVAAARDASAAGFDSFWLGQAFGPDALTALAVAAPHAPDIELAVGVVPIWTRLPQTLAGQALTVQAASAGRLTLGVGLSHRSVVEEMWGQRYTATATRAREYLGALNALLGGDEVEVRGETLHFSGRMLFDPGTPPPQVLLGALGPRMLEVAATEASGTITGSTGPHTLADHIVPSVVGAAARAGCPAPRIVTHVVALVTDDVDGARLFLRSRLQAYGEFPSFRAMLDREGVASQADVALVGNEDDVRRLVEEYEHAGVTDLVIADLGREPQESKRTRDLFAELARERRGKR